MGGGSDNFVKQVKLEAALMSTRSLLLLLFFICFSTSAARARWGAPVASPFSTAGHFFRVTSLGQMRTV